MSLSSVKLGFKLSRQSPALQYKRARPNELLARSFSIHVGGPTLSEVFSCTGHLCLVVGCYKVSVRSMDPKVSDTDALCVD